MKFLVVFALAVLACVDADCGCLKGQVLHHESHHSESSCSKHLSVAGEINGAPGYKPIKVIYRCQNGQGSCPHFPSALPIQIQTPVSIPDVPVSCGGNQYSYGMQAFYNNPSLASNYQGTYDNSHQGFSHGFTQGNCYGYDSQDSLADGLGIHPITVQTPVPIPQRLPNCIPMQGLKATIDRVVLPSNPHPGFRRLIDSTDRYNPVYRQCPELLQQRERDSCRPSCPCARPPTIQLLNRDRYENLAPRVSEKLGQDDAQCLTRKKRQLPFLDHGYKFVMNMLPPFIKDPIRNTVNIMALTHPDKKLQKMYNQPPKQTLHEKLLDKHKKNVANLKELLVPTVKKVPKKYAIDDHYLGKEAANFIDSLQEPQTRSKKLRFPGMRTRNPSYDDNEKTKSDERNHWLREMNVHDILDNDLLSSEETNDNVHMTKVDKLLFRLKLKKLNEQRSRREAPSRVDSHQCPENFRKKRSIIIDSEELSLPLYQVRLEDSEEQSKESEEYEDEDYYEPRERIVGKIKRKMYEDDEDYFEPRERIVGKIKRKMYEDDEDYFEPRKHFGGHRRQSDDVSKERMMRKAIREELRKFKRVESEEQIVGAPSRPNKMFPQSPLVHLMSLPIKLFSGFNDFHKQAAPIVGSVPKIIVGTKKYFRDFGRNFKKNALHFASDVIGDFDHVGPTNNILGAIFNRRRHKRNLDESQMELSILRNVSKIEPQHTSNPINDGNNLTSHQNGDSENKVRKKRYIIKMIDDDEVEAILRKKLEKLFDESEDSYKPQRRRHRRHKYSDESNSGEVLQSKRYARRRKYDESEEDYKQNIIVEKVRPKVIIDNNGLPFMELDGYRRPILMNRRFKKKKIFESSEDHGLTNYDSSEEANLQKIHGVMDIGKNYQSSRNSEMPLQTLKEKISQLLFETDVLVHMDFGKYDEIYDDLINIQQIKTSTVQDWKRLIMEKKINDREAKISLLGKFHEMQRIKEMAVRNIVYALYLDNDNKFVVKEFTKILIRLQKLQCIVNQVVGCFQQKFSMGTKFEMAKEIKYVDYLASTNFVYAKTRNDLIAKLREARDCKLQANIQQLEKLKKMLVENDEGIIGEESNILWEMKNIEKMLTANIEEMYHNLEEGCTIKKNLKILFDFLKRLKALEMEEKKLHSKCESQESSEGVEVSIEDKKSIKIETNPKKFDMDQFKRKWQDKMKKNKFLIEKNLKKTLYKLKLKNESDESDESE